MKTISQLGSIMSQCSINGYHKWGKWCTASLSSSQILLLFLLSSNQHISNRMRHVRWCIRINNSNIKQCFILWEPYTSYPQTSNKSRNTTTTLLHNGLMNNISVCQSCQITQSIKASLTLLWCGVTRRLLQQSNRAGGRSLSVIRANLILSIIQLNT